MNRFLFWTVIFLLGISGGVPLIYGQGKGEVGVLILAHGGSAGWNGTVQRAVSGAGLPCAHEIAFGMGMHAEEVQGFQQAVERLERQGVKRIAVLPLLVSSSSEVMDQFEYLFGMSSHGPWEDHVKPVVCRVPVSLMEPLDDDPVVSDILLERARALSRDPVAESVVLIAHGPVSDENNKQWMAVMERIAGEIRRRGGFKAVIPLTLRDDASSPVRQAAVRKMREVVTELNREGEPLVIPFLLAQGGIEHKIPEELKGLRYRYTGDPLLPHDEFSRWIRKRVDQAEAP